MGGEGRQWEGKGCEGSGGEGTWGERSVARHDAHRLEADGVAEQGVRGQSRVGERMKRTAVGRVVRALAAAVAVAAAAGRGRGQPDALVRACNSQPRLTPASTAGMGLHGRVGKGVIRREQLSGFK